MDLKLDQSEDFPRRFVVFPCGTIVAYGDENGTLVCLDVEEKGGKTKVRKFLEIDEAAIRAVTVSTDGRRVALGFDNGETRIYHFDDYTDTTQPHPFIPSPKKRNNNDNDSDDEDDDDDDDDEPLSQEDNEPTNWWAGPTFEADVRDLTFFANSHWLAIASEASDAGICVVNTDSADTMGERYLQSQCESDEAHKKGGVRGIATTSGDESLVASLAMAGNLCVWNASPGSLSKLENANDKVPVTREDGCVPKNDTGTQSADVYDRSCLPCWVSPSELALPGKIHLQLRRVSLKDGKVVIEEAKNRENSDPSNGHIDTIVALTSVGNFIVSSGRDGRVILWHLGKDEDGLPTCQFVQKLGEYSDSPPTSLYWNASNNTLYIACANGELEMVKSMNRKAVIPSKKTKATRSASSKSDAALKEKQPLETSKKSSMPASKDSSSDKPLEKSPTKESDLDDIDDDLAMEEPKSTVFKPTASKKAQRKALYESSEDEDEKSVKDEKEEKQPTPVKRMEEEVDAEMKDLQSDEDEEVDFGPETQPPPPGNRSILEGLDSDDGDEDENDKESATKSSPKPTVTGEKSTKTSVATKFTMDGLSDDDESVKSVVEVTDGEKASPNKKLNKEDSKEAKDEDDSSTAAGAKKTDAMDSDEEGDEVETVERPTAKTSKATKRLVKPAKHTQDDDDDDDVIFDEDDDNKTGGHGAKSFIEDEAEDANENEEEEDISDDITQPNTAADVMKSPTQGDNHDNNQDGYDDNDNGDTFPANNDDYDDDDNSMADDIAKINESYQQSRHLSTRHSGPALPEPQSAFAPSSTPLDLPRRFLCWNHVGSVTLMQGDDVGRSTVDINFNNSAFTRPISFTDNMGFILGSLGEDGAIFATDLANDEQDDLDQDEDLTAGLSLSEQTKAALKKNQKQRMKKGAGGRQATGSSIYFHRYQTFGNIRDKDWFLTLPDGERVLGCASGEGWAAVATSRKFLRFYRPGGAQGRIVWLPGNPVTMVGRNRFLAVFYHESLALPDGTQRLGYMLYDAVAHRTISKGSVACISSGSSLSWAGFSNDHSLMAMDSDGMLSMLFATCAPDVDAEGSSQNTSWEWAPMLDTVGLRKSSDDSFWPTSCHDGKLICIPLKGGTQYPDAARRPIPAALKMKMPLARGKIAKSSALEEISIRSNMALGQMKVNNDIKSDGLMDEDLEQEYHKAVAGVDKVTLKLFNTYVEAHKLERAYDVVQSLNLEQSYGIAVKIADTANGGQSKLGTEIIAAKEKKFPRAEMDEDDGASDDELSRTDDYEEDQQSYTPGAGVSRNISPEINYSTKSSKRTLANPPTRNVRARAF